MRSSESPIPRLSTQIAVSRQPVGLVLLLSWLLPGYGFFVNGLKRRGLMLFLVLETVFLLGAGMRGSVLRPDFTAEGFNIVSLLSFLTQMFNGLLSLLSLLPDLVGARYRLLPYDETYAWADLGAFYLLVSGGLNYFVLMSTYDHFYGNKRPEITARRTVVEAGPEKTAPPEVEAGEKG